VIKFVRTQLNFSSYMSLWEHAHDDPEHPLIRSSCMSVWAHARQCSWVHAYLLILHEHAYEHMLITAREHMLICSWGPFRSRRLGVHSSFMERWKPRHHCKNLISLCTQNNVYHFSYTLLICTRPTHVKMARKDNFSWKKFVLFIKKVFRNDSPSANAAFQGIVLYKPIKY
jgi:hypothetical protein